MSKGDADDRHRNLADRSCDPRDVTAYYDAWAKDYDADLDAWAYEAPVRVAEQLRALVPGAAVVLDAGCGTGLAGRALAAAGFSTIDGVIAAAGNSSSRQIGYIAPVGSPANCPSIVAVAAVDQNLDVADFSCGAINDNGGDVDIAAPGVDVFSSFPTPRSYRVCSGARAWRVPTLQAARRSAWH